MRTTDPMLLRLVLSILLAACAAEDEKGGADSASDTATTAFCATAPALTWETWGHGFMAEYCLACHSADAPNRYGAPTDMNFDTAAETWAFKDEILLSVIETSTEPPGGGVYSEDRDLLEAWLRCAESGT